MNSKITNLTLYVYLTIIVAVEATDIATPIRHQRTNSLEVLRKQSYVLTPLDAYHTEGRINSSECKLHLHEHTYVAVHIYVLLQHMYVHM